MQSPAPANYHQSQTSTKEEPAGPAGPAGCSASSRYWRTLQPVCHTEGSAVLPSRASAGSTCWCSHPWSESPTHVPTPPTRLRGQSQTLCIFPQERSAGLILARGAETQVQGQEQVLWTANGSQAPCFLPSLSDLKSDTSPPWASVSKSEERGPVPDQWPSTCSPYFQGSEPWVKFQRLLRVAHEHKAGTHAHLAGLVIKRHQSVQLRLHIPTQRCL